MFDLSWVSMAIAIFVAIYLFIALGQIRKLVARKEQQIKSLQRDLRSLCSAAVNVGERLERIERESNQLSREQKILSQKQSQSTVKIATAENSSFDHAAKLANKGVSVEEMADICNITLGEAELINMMHRLEQEGDSSAE